MPETDRLILRRWLPRDREPFAAMNADPAVMDFPRPLTRAESDAEMDGFVERWAADGFCWAAVERRSDGAFVGMVGLARCEMEAPICPCVEIGWRLPRALWGQGYATEAARAWLDHGFAELGLAEIVAFTDPGHARVAGGDAADRDAARPGARLRASGDARRATRCGRRWSGPSAATAWERAAPRVIDA